MGCIPLRRFRASFCYICSELGPLAEPWIDRTGKLFLVRWLRASAVDFSVTQDLEVQAGTPTTLEHRVDLLLHDSLFRGHNAQDHAVVVVEYSPSLTSSTPLILHKKFSMHFLPAYVQIS